MNIESFKKKEKPKKDSELKKFENEILELVKDGYSLKSIQNYLNSNGIVTSFQNVSLFLKKVLKTKEQEPKLFSKIEEPKKDTPIIEEKKSISLNEMKQLKEENTQEPTQKKSLLKTSNVKKFEIIEPDYSKFIH